MTHSFVRLGAALVLGTTSAGALAQTYGPSNLPAGTFSTLPSSVSIGDTFNAGLGIVAPASGTNPYNFVDVYTFTLGTAGNATADTVTFNFAPSISNLQIALFGGSTGYAPGTYVNQTGSTSGALQNGGWSADVTTNLGIETVVSLSGVALAPGQTYTLEVRGDAPTLTGTQTASYSGNLSIQALPEPATWSLALAGALGVAAWVRRRRHAGSAAA